MSRDVNPNQQRCLEFFYFMYGESMGELNVYTATDEAEPDVLIWTLKGEQGKEWLKAKVPLPYSDAKFKVTSLSVFQLRVPGVESTLAESTRRCPEKLRKMSAN